MNKNILFAGDAGVDFYKDEQKYRPGGCSLNGLCHAFLLNSHNDIQLQAFTPMGNDQFSTKLLSLMKELGCGILWDERMGKTPCQEIELLKNGEKNFVHYDGGVLEKIALTQEEKKHLKDYQGFLVMPVYQQIKGFNEQVLQNYEGSKLVLDFLDGGDFNKDLEKMIPLLQGSWLSFIGLSSNDKEFIEELQAYAIQESLNLIISLGKEGAFLIQEGKLLTIEVEPIEKMVDSTGAGDALIASFLYHYIQSSRWEESLKQACEYARENVLFKGALPEHIANIFEHTS